MYAYLCVFHSAVFSFQHIHARAISIEYKTLKMKRQQEFSDWTMNSLITKSNFLMKLKMWEKITEGILLSSDMELSQNH